MMKRPRLNELDAKTFPEAVIKSQTEALELLESCNPKPVIAIDLDFTLWPMKCFEQTMPPYLAIPCSNSDGVSTLKEHIQCKSKENSGDGKDFKIMSLYPQAREVLEWCLNRKVTMSICSRSPDKSTVEQALNAFDMWDWFLLPQIFNKRKSYHFRNLAECTGLKFENFLFFDDDPTNVKLCRSIGVSTCQVTRDHGLDWSSLVTGLKYFLSNQISRRSLNECLASPLALPQISETEPTTDFSAASSVESPSTERVPPIATGANTAANTGLISSCSSSFSASTSEESIADSSYCSSSSSSNRNGAKMVAVRPEISSSHNMSNSGSIDLASNSQAAIKCLQSNSTNAELNSHYPVQSDAGNIRGIAPWASSPSPMAGRKVLFGDQLALSMPQQNSAMQIASTLRIKLCESPTPAVELGGICLSATSVDKTTLTETALTADMTQDSNTSDSISADNLKVAANDEEIPSCSIPSPATQELDNGFAPQATSPPKESQIRESKRPRMPHLASISGLNICTNP